MASCSLRSTPPRGEDVIVEQTGRDRLFTAVRRMQTRDTGAAPGLCQSIKRRRRSTRRRRRRRRRKIKRRRRRRRTAVHQIP